ncbi:hypothetical protein SAMN05519104_8096 [Rhizobiales bacterium GAS188]|nr:hypothetical protein SAMN05519104_8096 [Rhizobiales bacterium GAS188]
MGNPVGCGREECQSINTRVPQRANMAAIRRALEAAGVIFVEENGHGPGVRLKK